MSASNLWVGSLPATVDDGTFRELLEPFGTVISSKCFAEKHFGLAKFSTDEEAQLAIDSLNGWVIEGTETPLIVRVANNDVGQGGGGKGQGKSAQPQPNGMGMVGAPPTSGGAENCNLWVGSLPSVMDDASFTALFGLYGTIVSAKCFGEKRYGFVKFSQQAEAQAAIDALNGANIEGTDSTLIVKFSDKDVGEGGKAGKGKGASMPAAQFGYSADPNFGVPGSDATDNLYVKELPAGMDEASVRQVFENYGQVVQLKIINNAGKGGPNGAGMTVAMVRMGSVDQAAWVVANVNGNVPQGLEHPISVTFKTEKGGGKDGGKGDAWNYGAYGPQRTVYDMKGKGFSPYDAWGIPSMATPQTLLPAAVTANPKEAFGGGDSSNLYVKNLPFGADELYMYKVFAPLGCVQSVKTVANTMGVIGFVKYSTDEEAQRAIAGVHGQPLLDGSVLDVSVKKAAVKKGQE